MIQKQISTLFMIFLLFWGGTQVNLIAANQNRDRILAPLIIQNLTNNHYKPRKIDNTFSEELFNLYLKNLDIDKKFLVAADIKRLKHYYHLLDDELRDGKNDFYTLITILLKQRYGESRAYYTKALATPFDFSKKDSILVDPENSEYAKDKHELSKRWRKLLKYRTLVKYVNLIEEQEKRENDSTLVDSLKAQKKSLPELEKEAREKVKKSYETLFKRINQMTDIDRLSIFINSITALYDPHTNYFPPREKENFDITMTGQLEGIGARLMEKDGYIEVVNIVPGSASYRQGELEAGDKILAVGQGDDEPVDVVDMPLGDVVDLIRGKKGTEVRLTVEKVNGHKTIIPIFRDIVIIEETYAKSARIEYDPGHLNIGYINLPKFYADFNRQGARSCAKDVEKEITKLKSEKVQGLIFDLRNNSGGSLQDVVEMAGLFIKTGGIVQVKARDRNPKILKDRDPKIQYKGPLVVLLNQYSASASEIFAAAMQDYQRGIILGTGGSSFGKGTVQTFFDLNRYAQSPFIRAKDLGALKVTTQKFYRINGDATQKKGVVPHISLPDLFKYIDIGEKEKDYVMNWDKIAPLKYSPSPQKYDLETIKRRNQTRVAQNEHFTLVEKRSLKLKEKKDRKKITLVFSEYREELKQAEKESKELDDLISELNGLKISNLLEDQKSLGSDSLKIELNQKWLQELKQDVYLHEAIMIIKDMIG